MSAKVHTNVTNREKSKQREKKVVYKGVLDNPFRIRWPSVPVNLQNLVLAQVVSLLDSVAPYRALHDQANRKRKREQKPVTDRVKKKRIIQKHLMHSDEHASQELRTSPETGSTEPASGENSMQVDGLAVESPPILEHVTAGINEVTRRLEAMGKARRIATLSTSDVSVSPPPTLKLVFVCRADVDPPTLIAHIPHLVAACNSVQTSDPLILVPLPKGSELTLAQLMGMRRVAILALDKDTPGLSSILSLVSSVPILSANWLSTQSAAATERNSLGMIPTHIKQLRTTSPKDMKAAKEERATGRAAAKQKRVQVKSSAKQPSNVQTAGGSS